MYLIERTKRDEIEESPLQMVATAQELLDLGWDLESYDLEPDAEILITAGSDTANADGGGIIGIVPYTEQEIINMCE